MSLEAILAAIEASGQAQADEIVLSAQERAAAILEEAQRETQQVRQRARQRAAMPAYSERERILHRARLDALRTIGDAREAATRAVLNQARTHLSQVRAGPDYPGILRQLTVESMAKLQSSLEDIGTARLEVDARDEALIAEIVNNLGLQIPISCPLTSWGGLVACSQDSRIVVINTLESRLERALPFLRRDLAALFEAGGTLRPHSTTATPAYGQ